jgi:AcrR family transcriptional regulator
LVGYDRRVAIHDSAATKRRILAAATAEFAEHGLAGARVDRIARRAGANKQLIYAYFGSKEGSFDSALEANVSQLLDAVPFTADDLPAYAGALFDFAVLHPQLLQLVRWHQLERPGVMDQLPETGASNKRKLEAVAAAQKAGTVGDTFPADQLFALLLTLIHGSAATHVVPVDGLKVQREWLVAGVRRLCAPA